MKKGDIREGIARYTEFPNKTFVEIISDNPEENGKLVIVKNSIPGQKVRFMINKRKNDKIEARLMEVISDSPSETAERCRHFRVCGGCTYQSMEYDKQLELKEGQVKSILDKAIPYEYEFEGITPSPMITGYRNKMEYTFGDEVKGGEITLGLHKRNSMYDIVNVTDCKIVEDDFGLILNTVTDYFKSKNIPYFHKIRHEGYLRHLLVRRAVKTKQILVDIVTTTQMDFSMDELAEKLKSLNVNNRCESVENKRLSGEIVGFLHTYNDSLADAIKNDRTEIVFGRDYIEEDILGLKFRISAFSFFQTNTLGAEKLYSKARDYIGTTKEKIVFDLYSGTGTIAQILAPVARKVVGVEIVEEAVVAARENARYNGLDNCEFIADDVLKALDNIAQKPDLIILDPPRDGIHPKALEKIIDYGVDHMVYISCKPTSLARDLVMLQERGYKVVKGCLVDMFPGTYHVETVCLLSKKCPV